MSRLSSSHKVFTVNISNLIEPTIYQEAAQYLEWVTSMNEEVQALLANDTWEIVSLPKSCSTVGVKLW